MQNSEDANGFLHEKMEECDTSVFLVLCCVIANLFILY